MLLGVLCCWRRVATNCGTIMARRARRGVRATGRARGSRASALSPPGVRSGKGAKGTPAGTAKRAKRGIEVPATAHHKMHARFQDDGVRDSMGGYVQLCSRMGFSAARASVRER